MNINGLFGHIDMFPVIYGLVVWLGIVIVVIKLRMGKWLSLMIDIAVFWFVFKWHGGAMNGSFAAAIAAMLSGLTLVLIWNIVGWLVTRYGRA
jgi:hypothetical protein